MADLVMFQEMIRAGVEELAECRKEQFTDEQTVELIFLAMYGMHEMRVLKLESESIH